MIRLPERLLSGTTSLILALASTLHFPAAASGLSALVSLDCTGGRLQLVLENRTDTARTFTVAWPGRPGSPWTRTVAPGGDAPLHWTVPPGPPGAGDAPPRTSTVLLSDNARPAGRR